MTLCAEIEARLRSYVAGAIIPWINPECADQVPLLFTPVTHSSSPLLSSSVCSLPFPSLQVSRQLHLFRLSFPSPSSFSQEYWGADLRNVTVLFVNLGLREHDLLAAAAYDDAMKRCHDVLLAVQVHARALVCGRRFCLSENLKLFFYIMHPPPSASLPRWCDCPQ